MTRSCHEHQTSAEAYELRNIRENLRHIGAWVEHWRGDASCRLPCTPSSLDSAEFYVTISLRALDRIETGQALAIKEKAA